MMLKGSWGYVSVKYCMENPARDSLSSMENREHKAKTSLVANCIGCFYVNLTQARFIREEGASAEKRPP